MTAVPHIGMVSGADLALLARAAPLSKPDGIAFEGLPASQQESKAADRCESGTQKTEDVDQKGRCSTLFRAFSEPSRVPKWAQRGEDPLSSAMSCLPRDTFSHFEQREQEILARDAEIDRKRVQAISQAHERPP